MSVHGLGFGERLLWADGKGSDEMIEVVEINRIEDLEKLRPAWRSLQERTPHGSFFQSLEWLEVYWRHFGAGQTLRVLVVLSAAEPVGILPLTVLPERTRVGTVRTLTYPLHAWASYYGPIGPDPRATLVSGLTHVCGSPPDWDLMELRWAGEGSSEQGHTADAMRAVGLQSCSTILDHTAVIDLEGTWDDFLARHSSKWRNNLFRSERRLSGHGWVRYQRYRPRGEAFGENDPRWDLYDACEEIAAQSWQGGSQSGTTLTHPSVRPFFRDAHAAATRAGAVDLNLLWLDDRPLAFAYNYHAAGRVFGLRAGYHSKLPHDGAGRVIFLHALRDSYQRGDKLYDLGVGYFDAKRFFLSRLVPVLRYSHFRPAVARTQILRIKRWFQHCWQATRRSANRSQSRALY